MCTKSTYIRVTVSVVLLIVIVIVIVLSVFVARPAFAATPTTEPSLPADIETETWNKQEESCTKHEGKALSVNSYMQVTEELSRLITVVMLNGKKVAQWEETQPETSRTPFVAYVKNSPEKNWLAYTRDELEDSNTRLFSETGLTPDQFASCGR